MQQGSLKREPRRGGPDVWSFRWRERDGNGKSVLRRTTFGSIEEYHTETEACRAIAGLIRQITSGDPRTQTSFMTMAELANHFELRELPPDNPRRSHSTKRGYHGNLQKWIVPRWGNYRLPDVKSVEVESWLSTLPLANNTRRKLRDLMYALYAHASRYDLYSGPNPMHWVRQSGKRRVIPVVLEPSEIEQILTELSDKEYVMILIAAFTGLRRSEIFALKWKDIDFERKHMKVQRSIVLQVEGSCKTESSTRPVPLHDLLAGVLEEWREQAFFAAPEDWVFASPFSGGKKPFWPNSPMIKIKKIANRLGIAKRIGWHTFRRTFATLLIDNGVNGKVAQELMRHGSFLSTMNIYAQAITKTKRRAQSTLVQKVFPCKKIA
jgi:integrase